MISNTDDIQINKIYHLILSKDGNPKKGKILGYVKYFNEIWVYFQVLEKKWLTPVSNFAINEIGIGETVEDARKSYSKITYGKEQFLYDTDHQLNLDLKEVGEVSKGIPEYINIKGK